VAMVCLNPNRELLSYTYLNLLNFFLVFYIMDFYINLR
jgi:hypothetical protein